jgi:DNA-binding MarR family transcriptional regulator
MSQHGRGVDLDTSLGYLLKEAASGLRTAMEGVLRPLDLNISQYACLELLAQRPGLSNSELARGAFISRQSMSIVLQSLEREGLVVRPAEPPTGRVLPTELTEQGRRRLEDASAKVRAVEDRMRRDLDEGDQERLRRLLGACIASLRSTGR